MAAAIAGWTFFGAVRCRAARVSSDLLSPILPTREHGVSLERAVQLGDFGNRRQRVGCLVVAERFDDAAAKEVLPFHDEAVEHVTHSGIAAVGRERTHQRRPDEL